jgi:cell division protein FtsL
MSLRAFLVLLLLTAATVLSGIRVVQERQESRRLFVELTRLENERDELEVEYGRLKIEQATWSDNARVAKMAAESLGLVAPQPTETRIVTR